MAPLMAALRSQPRLARQLARQGQRLARHALSVQAVDCRPASGSTVEIRHLYMVAPAIEKKQIKSLVESGLDVDQIVQRAFVSLFVWWLPH